MPDVYLHGLNPYGEPVPIQCDAQGRLYLTPEPSCIELQNSVASPVLPTLASLAQRRYGIQWQTTTLSTIDYSYQGTVTLSLPTEPVNHQYLIPSVDRPELINIQLPSNALPGIYRLRCLTAVEPQQSVEPITVRILSHSSVLTMFAAGLEYPRVYYPYGMPSNPPVVISRSLSDYRDPVGICPANGGFQHKFHICNEYTFYNTGESQWIGQLCSTNSPNPEQLDSAGD